MNCPECGGNGFMGCCPTCDGTGSVPGEEPEIVALTVQVKELKKLLRNVLPPNCWECEWKTCPIEEKYQWCRPTDCPAAKALEVDNA